MSTLVQQVNLYQPVAPATRAPLSAVSVVRILAIVGLALLGVWGFSAWQVRNLIAGVETVRLQQGARDSLEAAGMQEMESLSQEELDLHVAVLTAALDTKSRALAVVRAEQEQPQASFADRLAGLARAHVDGLWLEQLTLGGSAREISLTGTTLDAELVPRYLQQLAKDPSLRGALIDELVIERRPASGQQPGLRFHANSETLRPAAAEGET
jgi:hypothetical protein